MNELNYASLEASKKLVDNGIWLETECYFEIHYTEDSKTFYLPNNNGTDAAVKPVKMEKIQKIPRPCFTEVWRELPEGCSLNKLQTNYARCKMNIEFESENPTDALIDLLVWLKGEGIFMKAFLPGIGKVNCYSVKSCTWKEDEDGNWATKCGNLYVTNYGTPRGNKMKFCCFCGNKLRQVEYREK